MIVLTILLAVLAGGYVFFQHPQFGGKIGGERLARMRRSKHFRNDSFQNLAFTPQLTEGATVPKLMLDMLTRKYPDRRPLKPVPTDKTDLRKLDRNEDVLVWFGHSSYYFQLDGLKFIVDPVMSGNASPIPGSNKAFEGSDVYTPGDIPEIDYLLLTHDHYDHADYRTLMRIQEKVKHAYCGLGTGAHLERWGYSREKITELDWDEKVMLSNGITLHSVPARHFSGRTFKRNTTLWVAFYLVSADFRLFVGGDSGYGKHFREIAERIGAPDLAVMENGQYDARWRYIHATPEEVLKAGEDMDAKSILPVHSGKFSMSAHPWYEPLEKITVLNDQSLHPQKLITPKIGELVRLRSSEQAFTRWWRDIM